MLLSLAILFLLHSSNLLAAGSDTNAPTGYNILAYVVQSRTPPPTNNLTALFSKYTGTNVNVAQMVQAATDLEWEYAQQGHPTMNIIIAPKQIRNGIATLDAFPGAVAQIVVAGNRYLVTSNGIVATADAPALSPIIAQKNVARHRHQRRSPLRRQ